jgi:hypothetical protein
VLLTLIASSRRSACIKYEFHDINKKSSLSRLPEVIWIIDTNNVNPSCNVHDILISNTATEPGFVDHYEASRYRVACGAREGHVPKQPPKAASAFISALIAASVFIGLPTNASAHTEYVYRTVHVVKNIWRVRDAWRTRYVYRFRRVVHVTQIQPIIHAHLLTRLHERTVAVVRRANVWETRILPARYIVTREFEVQKKWRTERPCGPRQGT